MTLGSPAAGAVVAAVASVRDRIAEACSRAGRRPSEVTLVAASKTRTAEEVLAAIAAGVTHFGENRVEEAAPKIAAVAQLVAAASLAAPTWHLIGHLQSRKAKTAVGRYALIHSVDTLKLGLRLARLAEQQELVQDVLLEVNLGDEESKFGFPSPDDRGQPSEPLRQAIETLLGEGGVRLVGLMGMAPIGQTPEDSRPYFRRLRRLRDTLRREYGAACWQHLSMGMTDDFEVAIEEGATLVRIGRAIFGAREAG